VTGPDGGERGERPDGAALAGSARATLALVTGIVMLLVGGFVALRPLWAGRTPLTTSPWLDAAFAFFFLLRGSMNVRGARRRAI
jgi:hypothetical protein